MLVTLNLLCVLNRKLHILQLQETLHSIQPFPKHINYFNTGTVGKNIPHVKKGQTQVTSEIRKHEMKTCCSSLTYIIFKINKNNKQKTLTVNFQFFWGTVSKIPLFLLHPPIII